MYQKELLTCTYRPISFKGHITVYEDYHYGRAQCHVPQCRDFFTVQSMHGSSSIIACHCNKFAYNVNQLLHPPRLMSPFTLPVPCPVPYPCPYRPVMSQAPAHPTPTLTLMSSPRLLHTPRLLLHKVWMILLSIMLRHCNKFA